MSVVQHAAQPVLLAQDEQRAGQEHMKTVQHRQLEYGQALLTQQLVREALLMLLCQGSSLVCALE